MSDVPFSRPFQTLPPDELALLRTSVNRGRPWGSED